MNIPDSVTSIEDNAFWGCGLIDVIIPGSVGKITSYAFSCCDSLTNATILKGVTSIDQFAFAECSNLTSVTIPESITSIGWMAFYKCNSLTDVYYGGNEDQWRQISISEHNELLTNATIHYNVVPSVPEAMDA